MASRFVACRQSVYLSAFGFTRMEFFSPVDGSVKRILISEFGSDLAAGNQTFFTVRVPAEQVLYTPNHVHANYCVSNEELNMPIRKNDLIAVETLWLAGVGNPTIHVVVVFEMEREDRVLTGRNAG